MKTVWPPKLSEAHIAQTCTQFLELDGWRAIKMEPVSHREWGKGTGEPGQADYLYIRYVQAAWDGNKWPASTRVICEVLWREWKRAGGKAAEHQTEWHARERARGALTLIAGVDFEASIEGFVEFYRKSGLQRKEGLRLR